MTTEEHKQEVLKYHPEAEATYYRFTKRWRVWSSKNGDADLLGFGPTEAEAWAQAAANAGRME